MENLSLFKNNRSGMWFIQYRTTDGIRKQTSTRCTHKADAVKVLADFGKFLADGSRRKQLPLSAFVKEFLLYAKTNYAVHTAYLYDARGHRFKSHNAHDTTKSGEQRAVAMK